MFCMVALFHVPPEWAHSYGCKSRRKLITIGPIHKLDKACLSMNTNNSY